MDGKKKNFGRFLQCQGEDDSDRSIDGNRIQEPPFDLRNRSSRGLGAELNSTGLLTAGSHVWPSVFVPPPQQPPLARHPAAAPRRSHEEKLAQGQIIKLLAVQEKTRTLVRSISKQLPTADHRRLFHEDVVRQQLHMERQHQSLLKQRLLSVKRANSGSVIRQYAPIRRHYPWPPMTQEDYAALEARLVADLANLSLTTKPAAATAQTETTRMSLDEKTPRNSDSSE